MLTAPTPLKLTHALAPYSGAVPDVVDSLVAVAALPEHVAAVVALVAVAELPEHAADVAALPEHAAAVVAIIADPVDSVRMLNQALFAALRILSVSVVVSDQNMYGYFVAGSVTPPELLANACNAALICALMVEPVFASAVVMSKSCCILPPKTQRNIIVGEVYRYPDQQHFFVCVTEPAI